MAELSHVFPLLRTVKAALIAGLPARITAYNADSANLLDITTPDAGSYYLGGSDLLEANGFPAIEIYIGRGALGRRDVGNVEIDDDPVLVVVVWAEGVTGEIEDLYETVTGLGQCVLGVLLARGAFGTTADLKNQPNAVTYDYAIAPADPTAKDRPVEKWRTAGLLQFMLEATSPLP
jgi:hypothetical protein